PVDLSAEAITLLSEDCLPDWYDDWAIMEAEEWRQLRLHALDALAQRLLAEGRFGDAVSAALAAMRADPLRESACATLIRVHLAEGNQSEAVRTFEQYQAVLADELGIEPTPALRALLPGSQAS
ncbi:MAG: bacterial transcriptional activator domain-containing protein, partial [Dehalococcoidia bacterium]|nr:bacterial transcriptional activator domain-containing protein [Dehalococcoidia bacterium]